MQQAYDDLVTWFITYRRTGGVLALLAFVAVALAATVLTVAVAGTMLIVVLALGAVVLLARAVLPTSWRRHTVRPPTPWPHETIEATAMKPADSSDTDTDKD